jgi:hypothetical protein
LGYTISISVFAVKLAKCSSIIISPLLLTKKCWDCPLPSLQSPKFLSILLVQEIQDYSHGSNYIASDIQGRNFRSYFKWALKFPLKTPILRILLNSSGGWIPLLFSSFFHMAGQCLGASVGLCFCVALFFSHIWLTCVSYSAIENIGAWFC